MFQKGFVLSADCAQIEMGLKEEQKRGLCLLPKSPPRKHRDGCSMPVGFPQGSKRSTVCSHRYTHTHTTPASAALGCAEGHAGPPRLRSSWQPVSLSQTDWDSSRLQTLQPTVWKTTEKRGEKISGMTFFYTSSTTRQKLNLFTLYYVYTQDSMCSYFHYNGVFYH